MKFFKLRDSCIFLFFVFSVGFLHAQQKIIDSLEKQVVNPTNGKTEVENLNRLSYFYSRSNPEKGLKKADQVIALMQEKSKSLQLGIALEYKGLNHKNLGNDSLAFLFYDKAENIYREIDSTRALSILMLNKGLFYAQRSKYGQAIDDIQNALEIFSSKKDTLLMGYSLGRLGFCYIYHGDYIASLTNFQKGALLLEQSNKQETMHYGSIMGDMGLLHQKLSKYEVALEYHNKCLEIYKKHDFQKGVSNQYNDIGNLYTKLEKFDKALEIFKTSYQMKKKTKNKSDIASALGNIGITLFHLKKYNEAIVYLDSSVVSYKDLKDKGGLSTLYHNLGNVHLEKNDILRAREYFDLAVFHARTGKNKRVLYLAKIGVSEAASEQANHKTAYNSLKEALTIKDSLLSDEKRDEIAALKAKYEYEKEKVVLQAEYDKNKAINEAEIKQQIFVRNISIGGGISGVLLTTIGFVLVRRKKEADWSTKIIASELQTLRAQLNPHFIFNTLNSINNYIQNNEQDIASNYLTRFSKMIRKVLENSEEEEIPLSDEVAFLENYIKLEQQRLDHKFEYTINISEDILAEETLVPPALLQPFIENSIWHGLSQREDDGKLSINIIKKQNLLICTIDDNGGGIIEKKDVLKNDKKSFGSFNVISRLDLLNKVKGSSDAKVEFIEINSGLRVRIQVPFSEDV